MRCFGGISAFRGRSRCIKNSDCEKEAHREESSRLSLRKANIKRYPPGYNLRPYNFQVFFFYFCPQFQNLFYLFLFLIIGYEFLWYSPWNFDLFVFCWRQAGRRQLEGTEQLNLRFDTLFLLEEFSLGLFEGDKGYRP